MGWSKVPEVVNKIERPKYGAGRGAAKGALAEGVGFEPTIRLPVYTLSKRAPSATRPSLRGNEQYSDVVRSHNPVGTLSMIVAKACNFRG